MEIKVIYHLYLLVKDEFLLNKVQAYQPVLQVNMEVQEEEVVVVMVLLVIQLVFHLFQYLGKQMHLKEMDLLVVRVKSLLSPLQVHLVVEQELKVHL
jgi:hypothetical protein